MFEEKANKSFGCCCVNANCKMNASDTIKGTGTSTFHYMKNLNFTRKTNGKQKTQFSSSAPRRSIWPNICWCQSVLSCRRPCALHNKQHLKHLLPPSLPVLLWTRCTLSVSLLFQWHRSWAWLWNLQLSGIWIILDFDLWHLPPTSNNLFSPSPSWGGRKRHWT